MEQVEAEDVMMDSLLSSDDSQQYPAQRSHSPVAHGPIFPAARIKRLAKIDANAKGGVTGVSSEALNMISRGVECFVEALARGAGAVASTSGRKTVLLRDLAEAVRRDDRYQFAHDFVPLAIPFEEAVHNQSSGAPPVSAKKSASSSLAVGKKDFFASSKKPTTNNTADMEDEE